MQPETTQSDETHALAVGQLRSFIERIERLEDEKKTTCDDIKDVYLEAKGNGFDTKAMREVIRLRKKEAEQRENEEAMREMYLQAMGMKS